MNVTREMSELEISKPNKTLLESKECILDLKLLLQKKIMPFSQKAMILKVIASICEDKDDLVIGREELEKAIEVIEKLRDGQISIYLNTGVVAALFGVTAFTLLLSPVNQSGINPPSDWVNQKTLEFIYVTSLGICVAFTFVCIFLCTFYSLIVVSLLPDIDDLLWFLVHIPSTLIVNLFVIFGIAALFIGITCGLYLIYSAPLAFCTLAFMIPCLSLYLFFAGSAAYPVFMRVHKKFNTHLEKKD